MSTSVMARLGEQLKDEAVDRVERSHEDWVALTKRVVIALANNRAEFTTDDVWQLLGQRTPVEPRAMGAAMRIAAREKIVERTDRVQKSVRPACHRRPVTVWRSLRYRAPL